MTLPAHCKCGARLAYGEPRCPICGRFCKGNRQRETVGHRGLHARMDRAAKIPDLAADILADIGQTPETAGPMALEVARALAEAQLLRAAAFKVLEESGPTSNRGKSRAAVGVWRDACDRQARLTALLRGVLEPAAEPAAPPAAAAFIIERRIVRPAVDPRVPALAPVCGPIDGELVPEPGDDARLLTEPERPEAAPAEAVPTEVDDRW